MEDIRERVISLDGTWISDVPSFYLSLGEAINGPNGYFGAGLDALADCLCGDFGVLPPLTIWLSHWNKVQDALDGQAWIRFRAESFHRAVNQGANVLELVGWGYFPDDSPASIARWTSVYEAALAKSAFDCGEVGSYFDAILAVFKDRGVEVKPELASEVA